jgi:hypothetical protein
MTAHESAEDFLRRFLDTYEAHDLEALWRFYSADCRFPILERFDMDPTWENYKAFMTGSSTPSPTSTTPSRSWSPTTTTSGPCTP